MINIIKQIFCKHKWVAHTRFDLKCSECKKIKYNPYLANKLLSKNFHDMYNGIYGKKDVTKKLAEKMQQNTKKRKNFVNIQLL